jgi:hypothetical protein
MRDDGVELYYGVGSQGTALCRTLLFKRRGLRVAAKGLDYG